MERRSYSERRREWEWENVRRLGYYFECSSHSCRLEQEDKGVSSDGIGGDNFAYSLFLSVRLLGSFRFDISVSGDDMTWLPWPKEVESCNDGSRSITRLNPSSKLLY